MDMKKLLFHEGLTFSPKTAHPSAKMGEIADEPPRIRRIGGRINIFTFSVE